MNKVYISGRLTKDVELMVSGDTQYANFCIAINNGKNKDGSERPATFVNCSAFNGTARFLESYCKKGTKIIIEGRLNVESYKRQDGTNATSTKVIVESVEQCESKQREAITNVPNSSSNQSMAGPNWVDMPSTSVYVDNEDLPF